MQKYLEKEKWKCFLLTTYVEILPKNEKFPPEESKSYLYIGFPPFFKQRKAVVALLCFLWRLSDYFSYTATSSSLYLLLFTIFWDTYTIFLKDWIGTYIHYYVLSTYHKVQSKLGRSTLDTSNLLSSSTIFFLVFYCFEIFHVETFSHLKNHCMQYMWFSWFWSHLKMSKNVFCVVARLSQRLKSMLFESFSHSDDPFRPLRSKKFQTTLILAFEAKMRPKLWKSHIVWSETSDFLPNLCDVSFIFW